MGMEERTSFTIGEEAMLTKKVTDADVRAFAELSGDVNPVHLDEFYATTTRFGRRIAHGMLVAGYISAVLGTRLPGPGAILISQSLQFKAPVFMDDIVTVRVRVTDWDSVKGRLTLQTEIVNQDSVTVLTGEARLVMASFLKS